MRTIVAGSRTITDYGIVKRGIERIISAGFKITEIVGGEAKGVDTLARQWAEENNIPFTPFPADWSNLNHEDAVIKTRFDGTVYDAKAGLRRNEYMAKYASEVNIDNDQGQLIAIIDCSGKSSGSRNMVETGKRYKLKVFLFEINK